LTQLDAGDSALGVVDDFNSRLTVEVDARLADRRALLFCIGPIVNEKKADHIAAELVLYKSG
jgi:hypothetical protein